jgi:hypothetical protein
MDNRDGPAQDKAFNPRLKPYSYQPEFMGLKAHAPSV